jgi:2-dehydro-3-deoxyphosphooctonate aldolase (KDO 8-P synthase)
MVDMLSFGVMKKVTSDLPVIFEVTRPLQQREATTAFMMSPAFRLH